MAFLTRKVSLQCCIPTYLLGFNKRRLRMDESKSKLEIVSKSTNSAHHSEKIRAFASDRLLISLWYKGSPCRVCGYWTGQHLYTQRLSLSTSPGRSLCQRRTISATTVSSCLRPFQGCYTDHPLISRLELLEYFTQA